MSDNENEKLESTSPCPVVITVKSEEPNSPCHQPPFSASSSSGQPTAQENNHLDVHIHVMDPPSSHSTNQYSAEHLRKNHERVNMPAQQSQQLNLEGWHTIAVSEGEQSAKPIPITTNPQKPQDVPRVNIPVLSSNDRCTPLQAQAMGKQVVAFIENAKKDPKYQLPYELQCSFEVVHKCLGMIYATFFLNLYHKANAPCLLCHACYGLYPPSQFIHHPCPGVEQLDITPCKSRMWRRCLVPLVTPGMDKLQQKQRWKFILEKFSHAQTGIVRRNCAVLGNVLDMPELKRGRFVSDPIHQGTPTGQSAGVMQNGGNQSGALQVGQSQVPTNSFSARQQEKDLLETDMTDTMIILDDVEGDDVDEGSPTNSMTGFHSFLTSAASFDDHLVLKTVPSDSQLKAKLSSYDSHMIPKPIKEPVVMPNISIVSQMENLVHSVKALESELTFTRSKLRNAEQQLKESPSEGAMREQLMNALATIEKIKWERDLAVQQKKIVEEKSTKLEQQLKDLKLLHSELGSKLANI